jgi:NAD(P)-dependent dehydrogenase (short-subunit alcohol dehydrogenase family)
VSRSALHVADINGAAAETVAAEIQAAGGRASARQLDVSDAAAVEAFAETIFATEGGVDILHNNAAGHSLAGELCRAR